MSPEYPDETVKESFPQLITTASKQNKTLHPSFFVELINYSRRIGVSGLELDELRSVVAHYGEMAIQRVAEKDVVGARQVQEAFWGECNDPFGDCSAAARAYLTREIGIEAGESLRTEVEKVEQSIQAILDEEALER